MKIYRFLIIGLILLSGVITTIAQERTPTPPVAALFPSDAANECPTGKKCVVVEQNLLDDATKAFDLAVEQRAKIAELEARDKLRLELIEELRKENQARANAFYELVKQLPPRKSKVCLLFCF